MKRIITYILIGISILGLTYLGITTAIHKGKQSAIEESIKQEQMVGGDRDEHGCIPSAGYTWCEEKQKCLRTFEEQCITIETSKAPAGEEN